jgi:hypothetical protein
MCVIIVLPAGVSMPKDALYNAVYNNPHSMGLILKDGNKKVNMIKEAPEEVDPERVMKLLEENKDVKRYLHLRWATKGGKNMENAQFFEVYSSNKRTIYFGHNGTLGTAFGGMAEKDPSDTKDFADKVVTPSLLRWTSENGKADYMDPHFHELIVKPQWATTSKGILVSNDLDDLMFGPDRDGWTQLMVDGEKSQIWVSNTDYFTTVKRGPENDRRLAAVRAEQALKNADQRAFSFPQNAGTNTGTGGSNTVLALNFARSALGRDTKIIEAVKRLFDTKNINTREGLRSIAYCTREEITEIVAKNPSSTIIELLVLLSDAVDDCMKDLEGKDKRLKRLQKRLDLKEGRGEQDEEDPAEEDDFDRYVPASSVG